MEVAEKSFCGGRCVSRATALQNPKNKATFLGDLETLAHTAPRDYGSALESELELQPKESEEICQATDCSGRYSTCYMVRLQLLNDTFTEGPKGKERKARALRLQASI